ncbi:HD domain-containing protein [Phenylobacterium sp. LjRoot219]|uniref:HD domain-containing protein n=1 Tax=Phenylobacterium sp. LjRoot219 TaxID=3342283 RepID=UPI003ED17516
MNRFPRLHVALDYAADAHQAQVRKGSSIPYLSHLLGVSSLVIEYGGDEDQAIAGLLHDVLEDCGAQHADPIRERFGERVLRIIEACTDGTPDESGQKAPWRERKRAYLEHLASVDEDTLLVSACDKLHNARAIAGDLASGQDVFARFKGGQDGTLWYYQGLLEIFEGRLGRDASLAIELRWTIGRMLAACDAAAA